MAGILEQKQAAMRARQAVERLKKKVRPAPEKWCPQCGEPYKGFTRYCPKCTYHRSRV